MDFNMKTMRDELSHCARLLGTLRMPIQEVDTINALLDVRRRVGICSDVLNGEIERLGTKPAAPETAPEAPGAEPETPEDIPEEGFRTEK